MILGGYKYFYKVSFDMERKSNKAAGTTLIELLVGFAILSVVGVTTLQFLGISKRDSEFAIMKNTVAFQSSYFTSLLRDAVALDYSAKNTSYKNCITINPDDNSNCSDQTNIDSLVILEPANGRVVIGTKNSPARYDRFGRLTTNEKEMAFSVYAELKARCANNPTCKGADAILSKLTIMSRIFEPAKSISYETYLNLRSSCVDKNMNASCPGSSFMVGFNWDCSPICEALSVEGTKGPPGDGSPIYPVHGCPPP